MLFKKALLPMVILASLTGCGPSSLDGSSTDRLDESIAKVADKLPDAQRAQFGEDITLIRSYYEKQNPDQLLTNLNGKNAADIATEAGNLREEQRLQQEKLAVEERQRAYLVELKEKKVTLEEAIKPLQLSKQQSMERAAFEIESGKIGQMKHNKTGDLVNGIELVLKNGTSEEIYFALFNGVLSVAGEEKPVLASGFDVTFETPLQPGETRTVVFIPPMISDWRSVAIPEGAKFTLETDELLNIANKPLFSRAEFSIEDQVALDNLLSNLKAVNSELGVAEGVDAIAPDASSPVPDEAPPPAESVVSEPVALLPEQAEDADSGVTEPIEPSVQTLPVLPLPATVPDDQAASATDPVAAPQEPAAPVDSSSNVSTEPLSLPVEPEKPATEPKDATSESTATDGLLPPVGQPETPVTPLKSA